VRGVGVGRGWVCEGCEGWLERSVPPPWPRGLFPARLVPTKHADPPSPEAIPRAGGAGLAARQPAWPDGHAAASGRGPGLHHVLEGKDLLPLLQLRILGRARLRDALDRDARDARCAGGGRRPGLGLRRRRRPARWLHARRGRSQPELALVGQHQRRVGRRPGPRRPGPVGLRSGDASPGGDDHAAGLQP
jgi:hypothetical protein